MRFSKDKYGLLIILAGFLVSLYAVFLFPQCGGNTSDCIISRENLFSDFYWHYNTIRSIAENGVLPARIETTPGIVRPVWHGPLYYYLSAGIYLFARLTSLNDLMLLHIFSAVITLFTNYMFFLFLKKVAKYFKNKYFVTCSLALFVFLPTALHLSLFIHPVVLFYFFFITSLYFYARFIEEKNVKNAILFGVVGGLGMLASLNAIIIPVTMFLLLVLNHFKKRYKERNLILTSLLIVMLLSLFSFIRNYLLFNNFFGDMHEAPYPKVIVKTISRTFTAFWGGIFGGNDYLYALIGLAALAISLLTIAGIIIYYSKQREKDIGLDFLVLINFVNTGVFINWGCNVINFIKTLTCVGEGIQNKYIVPFVPLIAVFAVTTLSDLRDKTSFERLVLWFILTSCVLFVIDFIWAFV